MEEGMNEPHSLHYQDPPSTTKRGGWRAIFFILGNELFEKLVSMSMISNMTVYLQTKYHLGGIVNVNVTTIWSGSSNSATLAGAFVADIYLGRFYTLLFGCITSLLGMVAMTLTASIPQLTPPPCCKQLNCEGPKKWQQGFLFLSLAFLAIGSGGIRPCNIAFGADQFDTTTGKGRAHLESFFNWWYCSFTVVLLIVLTAVVYIQTNVSWIIGFVIPTGCLCVSIIILLIGRRFLICKKPQGSIFLDLLKAIVAACRKRKLVMFSPDSESSFYDPPADLEQPTIRLAHTNRFKFLDKAAIIIDPSEFDDQGKPKNSWRLCSLQRVEQLKCFVAIFPVWISAIGCFLPMDAQNAFGLLQALQMNKSIGSHFKVPPAWMGLSSMIALTIWILVYECIFIPQAKRSTGKANRRLTFEQRMKTGIILSVLCMITAAIVEKQRRETALRHGTFISPLSIAYLLPQFILSGLIEVFAAISIMEFFQVQLPESMGSVAGAVFFLSMSVASYTSTLLVNVIRVATKKEGKSGWLGGHDLNKNRLDYYYWLLAGLGALNFIYFNFYASRYIAFRNSDESGEIELEKSEINRKQQHL